MTSIYHLGRRDYECIFGTASRIGKFDKKPDCPKCGKQQWKRKPPLVIEWEKGSDVIADFTFPGSEEVMITDRVCQFLKARSFSGFEVGPVSMVQNPKLKRPVGHASGTNRRVWLPYVGPPVFELWVPTICRLDIEKSGWELISECDLCYWREYQVDEEASFEDAPLFVEAKSWDGSDFFRLNELDLVFVTDKVANALKKEKFTNLRIEKRGFISGSSD